MRAYIQLWFAWKYLPLWYQQQLEHLRICYLPVVICLKISTFVVSTTTRIPVGILNACCDLLENIYLCGINNNGGDIDSLLILLWFAWKYLPLWYQQQLGIERFLTLFGCDLLENIYLCGINNNPCTIAPLCLFVVICLKISTFVVSTTTNNYLLFATTLLWFAWKYLPLWYQQQLDICDPGTKYSCDLLENIYLCGINNNKLRMQT